MPERARTDQWWPRGSNPPGPPGPFAIFAFAIFDVFLGALDFFLEFRESLWHYDQ